jgi:hypothetical protein
VTARLLVLDNSGSMPGKSRPPRARAAARHAISTLGKGSYVIVATFGSEARVVKDRFVFTDYDRQVLVDAVEGVVMNAHHTDVRPLEGLIEEVRSALAKHFSAQGFHLPVEVFTDGRPAPGDGRHQTFDTLLGHRTIKTNLGDGLFVIRVSFEGFPSKQTASHEPAGVKNTPAQTQGLRTPAVDSRGRSPRTVVSARPSGVYAGIGIALVLSLLLFGVRYRLKLLADPGPVQRPEVPAADLPKVLLVTELEEIDGRTRVLREGESIPIAPDAPVTFGTEASFTYPVLPLPDVTSKEVFRITPGRDGTLRLHATGGVLCDGLPVPRRGIQRRPDQRLRVQLGSRVWLLAQSNQGSESVAVDGLFARIAAGPGLQHRAAAPQG